MSINQQEPNIHMHRRNQPRGAREETQKDEPRKRLEEIIQPLLKIYKNNSSQG